MLILTIRTDKPEAEIGLFNDTEKLGYEIWQAHRQLAETIHHKIAEVLDASGKQLSDIEGIALFKGPGSFTGLRIGASVANALAASLQIPIVGTTDEDWLQRAIGNITSGANDRIIVPEYGAPVHITQQKK